MKKKKLNKKLNDIQATLNTLMHFLVEKPLETQLKIEEQKELAKITFETIIAERLPSFYGRGYVPLRDLFRGYNSLHQPHYSIHVFNKKLRDYCTKKGISLEFKTVKIKDNYPFLLHFKVSIL